MLFQTEWKINNNIKIRIPTVDEIVSNEDSYEEAVSLIVSTPYDMMVLLDDNGIDFTKINSWDLFCYLFGHIQKKDMSLVFGDLDLTKLRIAIHREHGHRVIIDENETVIFDQLIHAHVAKTLRKILFLKENNKTAGNEDAKDYLLKKARKKIQRNKRKPKKESSLQKLIVSLVNTSEFPYNYTTVRDITIYQFYSSLHQISHKIQFDNTMIGYYAGTVKPTDIDPKALNWLNL